ncbi:DDB1- and CUL4-associated factor 1-like isoform X3 [Ostrea edulis]|uniref:DDB1- and CUL4-associated factor 1-like isoform X3 n=1 Tax=Ostrea edulis TaxID=37623 RepID=UPI0024AEDB21|nr:DDB1- and CUL4-associated factor 1-like isoform X3 [Ostrea edulis]
MAALDSSTELNSLLEEWTREHNNNAFNVVSSLHRMAEILERETEEYYKMDPDPFDDRHPAHTMPVCALGHLMRTLSKNDDFMNTLTSNYLMSSNRDLTELHVAASRLLLDVMPALETAIVFQDTDGLERRLLHWAESCDDPLRSYATGLLARAMELQEIADKFKESNSTLVPLMLNRLHNLKREYEKENEENTSQDYDRRHFRIFAAESEMSPEKRVASEGSRNDGAQKYLESSNSSPMQDTKWDKSDVQEQRKQSPRATLSHYQQSHGSKEGGHTRSDSVRDNYISELNHSNSAWSKPKMRGEYGNVSDGLATFKSKTKGECSNSASSWAEMKVNVIGTYSLQPLSLAMKQRMILQYLTPMAEYQEQISAAFEHNALDLVFFYMDLEKNKDVRLAFEALKYTANLLCHKKFAIEFLTMHGVQRALQVPRPSVAACGVALCFYYLSYFEDAMERVCQLPEDTLSVLISYSLWLMECSHDSSRCHAAMFFGQSFPYRVILNLFDQKDGLRTLFNVISTLQILDIDDEREVNDELISMMRQLIRHVAHALKKYFEAHLSHKVDEIKRSHTHSDDDGSPVHETPAYKALTLTPVIVQENIEIMMELMPARVNWAPEVTFHKLGGIKLLCQLIALAPGWNGFTGKAETIKNALDVLNVLVATPKSQMALLESVPLYDNHSTPAISVLIGLADGEIPDPEVQKSALNVIINCVCGPIERLGGFSRYVGAGSKKRMNLKVGEDTLSKMWNGVRVNNGIMVLLNLLTIKTPITDADCIRALACKALLGLSRSETVRQIVSKLPLFNNGQIQILMKEPVLQDKQQEHVKFCKYANELLERVVGKKSNANLDASLEAIRRADIVAQSRITFQEKELLQLIHGHLQSKGLTEAAAALQREANLPRCATPPNVLPAQPCVFASPHLASPTCRIVGLNSRQVNHPSASYSTIPSDIPSTSIHSQAVSRKDSPTNSGPAPSTPGPIRFHLGRQLSQASPSLPQAKAAKSKFSSEKDCGLPSPAWRTKGHLKGQGDYDMTLDKIVTEYLRKQHALCRNPVTTCPPMSLFNPHRCPEVRGKRMAPINATSRIYKRMLGPKVGGIGGASVDRKFIYRRFKPCHTYRNPDEGGMQCCSFSRDEQYLMYGTFWGDIKLISLQSGEETASYNFNQMSIEDFQQARDSDLLLVSCAENGSGVWTYGDTVVSKHSFEDSHIEFSNQVQDRIIGTKDETANIYDVLTGKKILKLFDANRANNYMLNRATFNPTDELILNDGVLWDVRSGKSIHKFDKFNPNISGVFHPMGLEIIINSEVWDIRSHHLLHTVPALDQCQLRFNNRGDVIYAIYKRNEEEMEDLKGRSPYSHTFRTFDATDYTSITTIDVKSESISDLCTDKSDFYLAVVENLKTDLGTEENVCKLYEIGRLRDEDDRPEEDEDELDMDDVDDDDDDILTDFNNSNDEDGDEDDGNDSEEEDDDDDDNVAFSFSDMSEEDDGDDVDDDALYELL